MYAPEPGPRVRLNDLESGLKFLRALLDPADVLLPEDPEFVLSIRRDDFRYPGQGENGNLHIFTLTLTNGEFFIIRLGYIDEEEVLGTHFDEGLFPGWFPMVYYFDGRDLAVEIDLIESTMHEYSYEQVHPDEILQGPLCEGAIRVGQEHITR